MRIRIFLIMIKLLTSYSQQRKDGDLIVPISMDWKHYLLRSELLVILKLKLGAEVHHLALTGATSEDILEHIGDERYIIEFFLSIVSKMMDFNQDIAVNQSLLEVLLHQTSQQSHYLASKGVDNFDEYDDSNLRSILRKAGWMRKVYGVFSKEALADETSTDKLKVYFDTHAEALFELSRRVNEDDVSESDLKVMSKEVLIPIV